MTLVTGTWRTPDGAVLANASITAFPTYPMVSNDAGDAVVPARVTFQTNGSGVASQELFPGRYKFQAVTNGQSRTFPGTVPDAESCTPGELFDPIPANLPQTLTNKVIDLTSNTLRGTLAEFNAALEGADFATAAETTALDGRLDDLEAVKLPRLEDFGGVGDGVTNDNAAVSAANASGLGPFDLGGKTYLTTLNASSLSLDVFNGTLLANGTTGNQEEYRRRSFYANDEISSTSTKSRFLDWAGSKVLWLGTSIPQFQYPNLIAATLSFDVTNNAWAGSTATFPALVDIDPDGAINQIAALSMTDADVAAGLALYGTGSVFDADYDLITKAVNMTAEKRIGEVFAAGQVDAVVLDHNHNDRRKAWGTLAPPSSAISSVTFGATTAVTVGNGALFAAGDGVGLTSAGVDRFAFAAGRVQSVAGNVVTIAYDTSALSGTVTSGTLYKLDRATIFGAWEFLIYYIKGRAAFNGYPQPAIILCNAPSEYTGDTFNNSIWSVGRAISQVAAKQDLAYFDVAQALGIGPQDHRTYLTDGTHPTEDGAKRAIRNIWVEWMSGGAAPTTSADDYLPRGSSVSFADGTLAIYSDLRDGFVPATQIPGAYTTVLSDDFSGGIGAYTSTGTTPTVETAPWDAGESAVEFFSQVGSVVSGLSRAVALDNGSRVSFDLWLPTADIGPSSFSASINIVSIRSSGLYVTLEMIARDDRVTLRPAYYKTPNNTLQNLAQSTARLSAETQHRVTIEFLRDDGNGTGGLRVLLDDVVVCGPFASDDSGQSDPAEIRFGISSSNTGRDLTLYMGNLLCEARSSETTTSGDTSGPSSVATVNGLVTARPALLGTTAQWNATQTEGKTPWNWSSRPALAMWVAGLSGAQRAEFNGLVVGDGRVSYRFETGSTAIPDLPGMAPVAPYSFRQWGIPFDGTDGAARWEAMMDYLETLGGGEVSGDPGKTYHCTTITHASNVTVRLNGCTLAVHEDQPEDEGWYINRDINLTDATRTCNAPRIFGPGTMDGTNWAFSRWLSQADGTPVADPEADYVMGTGALASGISGVDLAAVLTGDAVTSVTVNNGGAGWNGHPTHPYIPSTVALRFEGGGGTGAKGFATIAGGTLTGVTVQSGGYGYTSPPTVTTRGGYADISLLVEGSVNRRNPAYSQAASAVSFSKANFPVAEGVTFRGFRRRVLSDGGCLRGVYRKNTFENCGKNDGPYHCMWVQSYGTPGGGQAFFADTEDPLIEDMTVIGAERSAILFSPTKGGTLRRLNADLCGESTIFITDKLNLNGGKALIDDCTLSRSVLTDIVAELIEHGAAKNLTVQNSRLIGSSENPIEATGSRNVTYRGNTFEDNGTGLTTTGDMRRPYGPFSERYSFNVGERPIAGEFLNIAEMGLASVGTLNGVGQDGLRFIENSFVETRATHPSHVFTLTKTGGDNLSKNLTIADNNVVGLPEDMAMFDATVGNVFDANLSVFIRGNIGHSSEAPVIVTDNVNFSATGLRAVECGFRPSRVTAYASHNTAANGQFCIGDFTWNRAAVRNDFSLTANIPGDDAEIFGTEVLRLMDASSATVLGVEFVGWTLSGFTINVITATQNTRVRYVCHP